MRPIEGEYSIYKIDNDSIFLFFELDFRNKSLPEDYFINHPININNEYLKSDYYKSIRDIFETEHYIYFFCSGPDSYGYEGLINKKTKELSFGKHNFNVNPRIFYSDGHYLYGYYEPRAFVMEVPENKKREFFKTISKNLGKVNVEDNLIIIKFSIQNN